MNFAYFLLAENKDEKERRELDAELATPSQRGVDRTAMIARLGGETRRSPK